MPAPNRKISAPAAPADVRAVSLPAGSGAGAAAGSEAGVAASLSAGFGAGAAASLPAESEQGLAGQFSNVLTNVETKNTFIHLTLPTIAENDEPQLAPRSRTWPLDKGEEKTRVANVIKVGTKIRILTLMIRLIALSCCEPGVAVPAPRRCAAFLS